MNILSKFKKVFVGEDIPDGAIITDKPVKALNLDKLREDISKTKTYVPWQIWQDHNHNNQRENTMEEATSWAINNDRLYTVYPCGCKFEEGLKKYSFSGNWCGQHCKKVGHK